MIFCSLSSLEPLLSLLHHPFSLLWCLPSFLQVFPDSEGTLLSSPLNSLLLTSAASRVFSPPPLLVSPGSLAPNSALSPPAPRSPSFLATPLPAGRRAHRSGGEARALVPQEVRDGGGTAAGVPAPPRRRSAAPPPRTRDPGTPRLVPGLRSSPARPGSVPAPKIRWAPLAPPPPGARSQLGLRLWPLRSAAATVSEHVRTHARTHVLRRFPVTPGLRPQGRARRRVLARLAGVNRES